MRLRRAAALSALLHVVFSAALLWLCAGSQPAALSAQLEALAWEPLPLEADGRIEVDLAPLGDPYLRDGDGTRSAQRDEAPTRYPGRDPQPAATASGQGDGARELEYTGRRDEQTLHTQLANAQDGYSAERIKTSNRRVSDDPVRQTPHPGIAAALASKHGSGEGRNQGIAGGEGPGARLPDEFGSLCPGIVLGEFLAAELLPLAPEQDAVGRERFTLASRDFLGATIDPDETYAWGWAEVLRIEQEMRRIAAKLNIDGHPTRGRSKWTSTQVHRVLRRMEEAR